MPPFTQSERKTQDRAIRLLQDMGWEYLGNWKDRENGPVVESYLRAHLQEAGYSDTLIHRALFELNKAVNDQTRELYDINQEVYGLLRYGVKVRESVGEHAQTVWLIDWKQPGNNHFALAQEVTVKGEHNKRPDLVLYVNGIALGVIELKKATVSVQKGIRQNLDNQKSIFIQRFFHTMQLVMAANDTEGLRYGTIKTPEKYYLSWKEESQEEYDHLLDKHLSQVLQKERFLELIHDFTLFDGGIKKVCRPHQYFGVKAAQENVKRREGGIIWHTQGSGKSLTMVWLARWIREHITNSRVVVITDRDELDKQIERVFQSSGEPMVRAKNGKQLIELLNQNKEPLICSLIHKFGRQEEGDYGTFVEQVRAALPPDFEAKGELFVFVDECHRTQSGKLHEAMKEILPRATFIGFTGTPLLKKDKQKSIEVFGPYIHTYKFDEAVQDGVVKDLKYEARDIDQRITDQRRIDQWFDAKTARLPDLAKAELKKRWGTMQKLLSSKSRLEQIVNDIIFDFSVKPRLMDGLGNAMLVAGSVYEACKYYELFQDTPLAGHCAIVTSYEPSVARIKGEETGEGSTEELHKYEVYEKMLGGKSTEDFEEAVKDKFIHEPARMKLLIVVDKLLTGFDAPPATYLYIDKSMQDHGLFQAICRVNRLDTEDKEFGYIVDYKDLFQKLEKSIEDYTSGAFADFDEEDVKGLLKDRLKTGKERLDATLEVVVALCEPVPPPREQKDFIRYFCGDPEKPEDLKQTEERRLALYKATAALIRAYANLANELLEAGYTEAQADRIEEQVRDYTDLREVIKKASGDYIDLKAYEPGMRQLIDMYISADPSQKISALDDMTLLDLIVSKGAEAVEELPKDIRKDKEAVAETIENNLRKVIIEESPTNPKYFEKMSELLRELILARRQKALDYAAYLNRIAELTARVTRPEGTGAYPSSLDSPAKRALYDNLGQNEELALALDKKIKYSRQDGWRGNRIKERMLRNAIFGIIHDRSIDLETVMQLIKEQEEY